MSSQIHISTGLRSAAPSTKGLWDGGSSSGSSGGSGNSGTLMPVEIRPEEDETLPVPEETAAETGVSGEEVVIVSILGEETVEQTLATEAPVAAELTSAASGSGADLWLAVAAVLAAALVIGLLASKRKKSRT